MRVALGARCAGQSRGHGDGAGQPSTNDSRIIDAREFLGIWCGSRARNSHLTLLRLKTNGIFLIVDQEVPRSRRGGGTTQPHS